MQRVASASRILTPTPPSTRRDAPRPASLLLEGRSARYGAMATTFDFLSDLLRNVCGTEKFTILSRKFESEEKFQCEVRTTLKKGKTPKLMRESATCGKIGLLLLSIVISLSGRHSQTVKDTSFGRLSTAIFIRETNRRKTKGNVWEDLASRAGTSAARRRDWTSKCTWIIGGNAQGTPT